MTNDSTIDSGKLPGKTTFSGRRRTTTRKSGFKSSPDSTGGELKVESIPSHILEKGDLIRIDFNIHNVKKGQFIGFGGWFNAPRSTIVTCTNPFSRTTLTQPDAPNWAKVGSLWLAEKDCDVDISFHLTASEKCQISLYEFACGIVDHKHLQWAVDNKPILLKNMYEFAPEANFIVTPGEVHIETPESNGENINIFLKSCNRCARFLPINIENERYHLSYSNHCVAAHRLPCSHGGFGKLKNIDTGEIKQLKHGYQLECRFCKKYEVNAAHNPKRTAAQMKEDGARRRSIELLLTFLYKNSPQLAYRHMNGDTELTNQIWTRFDGKCFNCGDPIPNMKSMHLDHTRPLALLWPLDGSATCLCKTCNNQKRDRPPADFYSDEMIKKLSALTGVPYAELMDPAPNMEAIMLLGKNRDWFFNVFLHKPELQKVRDGKVTAELLVKAIQKTLEKCPGGAPYDLYSEYKSKFY